MKRALLLVLLGIAAPASAQSQSAIPEGASSGWMAISGVIMLVLVLVAVGVAVKAFDLKRRRESEAVLLQAQLSDALLRDASLAGLLVTPTAYVPYWSGSPATVVLEGRIPSNDPPAASRRTLGGGLDGPLRCLPQEAPGLRRRSRRSNTPCSHSVCLAMISRIISDVPDAIVQSR